MTWQTYVSILFCIKVLYFIKEAAGFEKFCISEIDFQAINNGASNSLTGNTSLVPPESSPCFNGGLCISYEDENETTTFECRCPGAFTGEFCQLRNPCSPDPCQNGGTCEIFGDSGVCHCPVNFRGLFCNESNPDFSMSTPPSATSSYTQTETESTSTKSSSEMPVVTVKLKPQYPPMLFSYDEIDEYDINIRRTKDASNAVTSNSRVFTGTHLITSESNRSPKISAQENPCNYLVTQGTTTCLNAGKCHPIDNISFECECSAKYTGKLCEFLNACVSSPCQNEGTCFAFEDSGICSCPLGYKGTFCEEKLEPKTLSSHSKPVLQNSKRHEESYEDYDEDEIVVTQSSTTRKSHKETNTACSLASSAAAPYDSPCMNGGTCISLQNKAYECVCPSNYTGSFCQFTNACIRKPCKNGGTCETFEDSGVCMCPVGYRGLYCEEVTERSKGNDHLREKVGRMQETIERLEKQLGDSSENPRRDTLMKKYLRSFIKNRPSEELIIATSTTATTTTTTTPKPDLCHAVPTKCKNNGRCIPIDEKRFECECSHEFSGELCEFVNPCKAYPCQNGGTCETFDDSAVCHCLAGYEGTYCETEESLSFQEPEELATRKPVRSKVWAMKKTDGPCESPEGNKCFNGGTCLPHDDNSFECLCSTKYTGNLCEFVNACEINPCKNGGTCESYEDSGVCNCPSGFIGRYCETVDDVTESYLSRLKKGRRFALSSFARPEGEVRLSRVLDHCDNAEEDDKKPTCLNGGRCNILDDEFYECECTVGFTGKFCQFLDVCGSSPCLNGGTCNSFEDSGTCKCSKGYTGVYCEAEEVSLHIMTSSKDSPEEPLKEVPIEQQESVLEHIYRSKIPANKPYPLYEQIKPQRWFYEGGNAYSDTDSLEQESRKDSVISIPGFEDITKDMVRVGRDGTIYIRKPKKRPVKPKDLIPDTDPEDDQSHHSTASHRKGTHTLDASIVKVMPNGELYIKVLLPKHRKKSKKSEV